MREDKPFSVSQLNQIIKECFDDNPFFGNLFIKGEISNFRLYPSGHAYFSLKDQYSIISGVMWASSYYRIGFTPKDGDEVLVHGQVGVYPQQGKYQIYCDQMSLFGQGNELLKLKELAAKLQKEGLFDESRKRPLPKFPKAVGIITAQGSAAIKDIIVNLQKRWPLADIVVFPSLVQGKDAPASLLSAFRKSQLEDIDVLIIGRGGGSSEDLSAFNDEALVRALSSSKCPTISAVGHEIDTSLTDLVADKRVSTPTGAAVAAVPDQNEIKQSLDEAQLDIQTAVNNKIGFLKQRFESLKNRPFFSNPALIYQSKLDDLGKIKSRLLLAIDTAEKSRKQGLIAISGRLKALSPYGVLGRGYSITKDDKGHVVASIKDVKQGSTLINQVKDGIIISKVESSKEKDNG